MSKVVYNACFGGFSLSRAAVLLARKLSGDPKWGGACIKGDTYNDGTVIPCDYGSVNEIKRTDPILIAVVEKLGEKADGEVAALAIAEIPTGTRYRIDEYDGRETIVCEGDDLWEIAT